MCLTPKVWVRHGFLRGFGTPGSGSRQGARIATPPGNVAEEKFGLPGHFTRGLDIGPIAGASGQGSKSRAGGPSRPGEDLPGGGKRPFPKGRRCTLATSNVDLSFLANADFRKVSLSLWGRLLQRQVGRGVDPRD